MRWIVDNEDDIGLTFWNIITFVKYKEHTLIHFFKKFRDAPKYVHASKRMPWDR